MFFFLRAADKAQGSCLLCTNEETFLSPETGQGECWPKNLTKIAVQHETRRGTSYEEEFGEKGIQEGGGVNKIKMRCIFIEMFQCTRNWK